MTAQVHDTLIYKEEGYNLIGAKGSGWISPEDFSVDLEPPDSGCWRGCIALYKVIGNKLVLDGIVMFGKTEDYPVINGASPKVTKGQAIYENLALSISFRGKVRIATGFRWECHVHMGFQKAPSYGIVLDLTFEDGVLTSVEDRSAEMEAKRGAFKKLYNDNPLRYIDAAFSVDTDIE